MFIDTLRSRGLTGRKKDPDDKGFTLVELLVVITILGILAAVVVFSVSGIGDKGEEAAAETDSSILATAQEAYCAKNGSFADPSILQRDGFLSSESGYNDAYVDTTQGSCGGMSFRLFEPKKTDYPVTIPNCVGPPTTYEGPPGKALAAYSSTHETMAWLELLDKTVAPAPQDPSLIPEQLEDDVARGAARNPVDFAAMQYAGNSPLLHDLVNFSAPTVVNNFANASPGTPADLIIFDTPDHVSTTVAGYTAGDVIGAFNGAGKNGQVYVGFGGGDCDNDMVLSDPNNPNSPLVDTARSSLEGVFANIRNLGVIFDVQEKAAEVIAQMRSRIGEALNKAGSGRGLQVAATFPFGGMLAGLATTDLDGEGKLALFPGNHSMNGIINLAGGKNIFADTFLAGGNPGSTSAAQIIGRNPDVLVLAAYAVDPATEEPLCDDNFFGTAAAPSGVPAKLAGTIAVGNTADANDRVVCHYFGSMVQPSISSIEVIEAIADELAKGPKTKEDNDV